MFLSKTALVCPSRLAVRCAGDTVKTKLANRHISAYYGSQLSGFRVVQVDVRLCRIWIFEVE